MTSRLFLSTCFMVLSSLTMAIASATTSFAHEHTMHTSITIDNAWTRATPAKSTVGAAYFQVTSSEDDLLLRAESPAAERTEVHQTSMDVNGLMQMRELAAGVELPSNQTITLAPGGTHIMLMGLKEPLKEGYEIPLTLYFKKAGMRTIRVKIMPLSYMPGMGADSMPLEDMNGMHDMHQGMHH